MIGYVLSLVGHMETGKISLGQSIVHALGRLSNASPLVVCAMRPSYGVTVRLLLLADLVYLHRRYARLVVWIRFYYCKAFYFSFPEFADLMTEMMTGTKLIRSVNQTRSCSSARPIPSTPSHHRFSIGVRSFNYPGTYTTRSYTLRGGPSCPSKAHRTGFQRHMLN